MHSSTLQGEPVILVPRPSHQLCINRIESQAGPLRGEERICLGYSQSSWRIFTVQSSLARTTVPNHIAINRSMTHAVLITEYMNSHYTKTQLFHWPLWTDPTYPINPKRKSRIEAWHSGSHQANASCLEKKVNRNTKCEFKTFKTNPELVKLELNEVPLWKTSQHWAACVEVWLALQKECCWTLEWLSKVYVS